MFVVLVDLGCGEDGNAPGTASRAMAAFKACVLYGSVSQKEKERGQGRKSGEKSYFEVMQAYEHLTWILRHARGSCQIGRYINRHQSLRKMARDPRIPVGACESRIAAAKPRRFACRLCLPLWISHKLSTSVADSYLAITNTPQRCPESPSTSPLIARPSPGG